MLLKRPGVTYGQMAAKGLAPPLPADVVGEIEMILKYEGYISKEKALVERMARLEQRRLPENLNYREIRGLLRESVEHLERVRPRTLGQALRIPGVTPADINVLLVCLEQRRREGVKTCAG
jgi:tRNA uridine 5-carboxymethylaminomethyl modification enzyme